MSWQDILKEMAEMPDDMANVNMGFLYGYSMDTYGAPNPDFTSYAKKFLEIGLLRLKENQRGLRDSDRRGVNIEEESDGFYDMRDFYIDAIKDFEEAIRKV